MNIAVILIKGYRLIPNSVRSIWSTDSSSEKALTAIQEGAPIIATLKKFAIPHFNGIWEPPSWDN